MRIILIGLLLVCASLNTLGETIADETRDAQITMAITSLQTESDPKKRMEGARELAELGSREGRVITALVNALTKEQDDGVSIAILQATTSFGEAAKPIIPVARRALASENSALRAAALQAISIIGQELSSPSDLGMLAPELVILLDDQEPGIRALAAFTLQKIGPGATTAVPKLIEHTADSNEDVRWVSLATLGVLDPGTKPVTDAAIYSLSNDPSPKVRRAAAFFMKNLARGNPKEAGLALVRALNDSDAEVRESVANAIGDMPREIADLLVPPLIEISRKPGASEATRYAVRALGIMGSNAHRALPDLIFLAQSETVEPAIAAQAVASLANVGTPQEVIDILVTAAHSHRRLVRYAAALAFGSLGPLGAEKSFTALSLLIEDNASEVRIEAIESMGKLGPLAKRGVPELLQALSDPKDEVKRKAAEALASVANSIRDEGDSSAVEMLREMQHALQESKDSKVRVQADTVRRAAEYLELTWWIQIRNGIKKFYEEHPKTTIGSLIVFVWFLTVSFIYWKWPIVILHMNEAVAALDFQLPDWLGGVRVPLRAILLIKGYSGRPRVLDAWTVRHIDKARSRFEAIDTVSDRAIHVDIPITIGGRTVSKLHQDVLQSLFASDVAWVLIFGEGGGGKTSLACALGRRSMAPQPDQRLARHLMLPIWIEDELDTPSDGVSDVLLETIRQKLKFLTDSIQLPSPELVQNLLTNKRLLVIVDRFSELSDDTRDLVGRPQSQYSTNALVITSRSEEGLQGAPFARVEPLRVEGNRLSSFLEAYLTEKGKRGLLTDHEFFACCGKLSQIVGQRTITVLLARLYADQVVNVKEQGADAEPFENVPALFVRYLNHLNQTVTDGRADDRIIQRDTKAVAWECVREKLIPTGAKRDSVLQSIGGPDAEERLSYLERKLYLIKIVEPDYATVRFLLDPLAEYLAALHLVQGGEVVRQEWLALLEKMEDSQKLDKGKGLLLAIADCLLIPNLATLPNGLENRIRSMRLVF